MEGGVVVELEGILSKRNSIKIKKRSPKPWQPSPRQRQMPIRNAQLLEGLRSLT